MNTHPVSQQQADLLDQVYKAALDGSSSPVAVELDPAVAASVRRVAEGLAAPAPTPAFAASLHAQLAAAADHAPAPSGRRARSRLFNFGSPVWRIAAALVLVAAVGAWLLSLRPQPVNAQEIVRRAQASLNSPLTVGLQSYFIAEQTTLWAPAEAGSGANPAPSIQSRSDIKRWFQAPDKWRLENAGEAYAAGGKPVAGSRWQSVVVSDGSDQYDYDAVGNIQTINRAASSPPDAAGMPVSTSGSAGETVSNLPQLFDRMADCYRPTVTGSSTVGGQAVYVIELGATLCPSAAAPDMNGREVLWVDKNTFFVLRHELYSTEGDRLLLRSEVTDVQYNPALDPRLFAAPAPSGARILDYRPQPLPTQVPAAPTQEGAADPQQAALLAALQPLAQRAAFPLFVPGSIPAGLTPRLPKLMSFGDTGEQLVMEFVPATDVAEDTFAGQAGIRVTQQAADYATLVNFTSDGVPVLLPGAGTGEAWARRGITNVDGTGTDSSVVVLRDGVLIAFNSFTFSPEQLLDAAATLQAVPGSGAPLPAPLPPTLTQVRATAPFPIYVPTWVPDGLAPEPPVGYQITYHDGGGQPVLTVTNGAEFGDDPRAAGESVTLTNGVEAHWLGSLLWWIQDGSTTMALSGESMSREDLIRIAASVSANADLTFELRPQLTPAPTLPTPTPVPTPPFAVQRPTWLPEEMKVSEQVDGSVVSLGFVPAAGGGQGALTLVQAPAIGRDEAGVIDPQASQESIGGREVIVIRRGAGNCVTYTWLADGLRLTLTNVYDPPGELKYSCEQMEQIVAGIR